MVKFIVLFLGFFLLWYRNAKTKSDWMCSSSFLLGLYAFCSFCAIFDLSIDGFKEPLSSAYMWPAFLFFLVTVSFLLPMRLFKENNIKSIVLPNLSVLNTCSNIIIFLSFFAIIQYASTVNLIFAMGDLGGSRSQLYAGEEFVEAGLFNTIASVSSSLYIFALFLFFVYSIIGGSMVRRVLLLISSLSEPIHVLAYVGRDGIVFWIFAFIFLFFFFKDFMPKDKIKEFRKLSIIGSSLLLIPFAMITIGRFANDDYGADGSIISYLGQPFIEGTLFMGINNPPCTHGSAFPLFFEITGIKEPISQGMIEIGEWRSWWFGTLTTSFCMNFGFWGAIVLSFLCFFFFRAINSLKGNAFYLYQFIIYLLFFQVLSQGVFYFRLYTRGGNLYIIICLLLSLFFHSMTNNNPVILERISSNSNT